MAKDPAPLEEDEAAAAARKAAKRAKKLAKAQAEEELAAQELEQKRKEKKAKKRSRVEEELEEVEVPVSKKVKKEKKAREEKAIEEEPEIVPEKKKKAKKQNEVVQDIQVAPKKKYVEESSDDEVEKKSAKDETPKSDANAGRPESQVFTAFVGGLRSHVDEDKIWADFAECGKLKDVILSRWPEDGSSKGMAFITFETKAALDKCLEWHDTNYEGAWIRVERKEGGAAKKTNMGLGGQRGFKPEGCKAVAVLNLSKEATEDDIWNFFDGCGEVTNVKIPRHRETYEPRGMAFVDFQDTLHTDKAVKLTGQSVRGQAVRVEYAAPKNDRGASKGQGKGFSGPRTKPDGCLSVVVKNLSKSASEDDVWHLIKECKSANNVSVLIDRDTWESRGIAFVDFDDTNDTDKAVELSGSELYGQPVSINFKMPK